MQPAVPPGLTLSAPCSSRTVIRSSLFTEELLRLPYFACEKLSADRFGLPSGVHSSLWCIPQSHRLRLSVMSCIGSTYSPSSVYCSIALDSHACQQFFWIFFYFFVYGNKVSFFSVTSSNWLRQLSRWCKIDEAYELSKRGIGNNG